MSWLIPYIIFFGIPMIIGLAVQGWLKHIFSANSQRAISTGKTGAEVAREILDRNGLHDVAVLQSNAGTLSDHYDPRQRQLALSDPVYGGRSIAATAVAAHEAGHALQHAQGYAPMSIRSAIWPLASLGSRLWFWLLIAGFILHISGFVYAAIVIYAAVVLFQLVTLPVEFNASGRAIAQVRQLGLVTNEAEAAGVKQTLMAAALTYVAGALAAIAQLLFFLFMSRD